MFIILFKIDDNIFEYFILLSNPVALVAVLCYFEHSMEKLY